MLELAQLRLAFINANRDRKKCPMPFRLVQIAPWLEPMQTGGKVAEAPDVDFLEALDAEALAAFKAEHAEEGGVEEDDG